VLAHFLEPSLTHHDLTDFTVRPSLFIGPASLTGSAAGTP
jgi:hypothetical protein